VEVLLVVVIMGALAALGIPNLQRAVERARITRAIGDVRALGQDITEYAVSNGAYPAGLADIERATFRDPWGNPYRYLVIEGASPGAVRKDRFLVPVNSDFDLYSMGADGRSRPPFTAADSRDDIVRANDGGYIGLAEDY
jgi:general secretion pathway protein G